MFNETETSKMLLAVEETVRIERSISIEKLKYQYTRKEMRIPAFESQVARLGL